MYIVGKYLQNKKKGNSEETQKRGTGSSKTKKIQIPPRKGGDMLIKNQAINFKTQ